MAEIPHPNLGETTSRRVYVPPTLERHEDWEIVTGLPPSQLS